MTPPAGATSARAVRRARARRLAIRFAVWVVVPTLLSVIYYGCMASAEYRSVAVFNVQSQHDDDAAREALVVREYIHSRGMLADLHERGLVEHYQSPDVDWWSRLDGDAGFEEIYEHYRNKVAVIFSKASGTITLKVRAFSADAARDLAAAIIESSQRMLDETAAEGLQGAAEGAQARVDAAQRQLEAAIEALARARAEAGDAATPETTDPKIESRIARAQLEKQLAQDALAGALKDRDAAMIRAAGGGSQIRVISEPSRPDEAAYPKRLWSIATVFVVTLVLMGIFGLLGAAIREHAKL